jgi:hypothetical protein
VKVASYGEIAEFCQVDGWQKQRSTGHDIWTKTLATGELLRTSTSHSANKTPSAGRFKAILRVQLRVSEVEFWAVHSTGKPVDRPGAPEAAQTPPLPAHLVAVLAGDLRLSPEEIGALELDEAERRVYDH